MKTFWNIALLVLLTLFGWMGKPTSGQAGIKTCEIINHTPVSGWSFRKFHFVHKDKKGFVTVHTVGKRDRITLSYKQGTDKSYFTTRRIRKLRKIFGVVFHEYLRQGMPFPKMWGLNHKKTGLEIYCGDKLIPAHEQGVLGWAQVSCAKCGTWSWRGFSELHLNKILFDEENSSPWEYPITVAHEVYHLLQFQAPHNSASCGGNSIPTWWGESTADAIGMHFFKKNRGSFQRIMQSRGATPPFDYLNGVRNYNKYPLDYDGSRKGTELIPYQTNSFWQHIGNWYYGKTLRQLHFLSKMLGKRHSLGIENTKWDVWLSITNRTLFKDNKRLLPHIYATFVTSFAALKKATLARRHRNRHYFSLVDNRKAPRIPKAVQSLSGDRAWLRKTFGGCKRITLHANSLRRSRGKIVLKLKMLTATCIRVKVKGLKPGTTVQSVKILASSLPSKKVADQLQMGLAYTTSATSFYCFPGLMGNFRGNRLAHCLLPFSPAVLKGKAAVSWRVFAQRVAVNQRSFENLYVLSRTPLPKKGCRFYRKKERCIPRLSRKDRKAVRIPLEFQLKYTHLSLGRNSKAPARVVKDGSEVATSTLNVTIMGRDLESIPMSGNVQSLGSGQGSAKLRHLFQGNIFNRAVHRRLKGTKHAGLRVVRFAMNKVKITSNNAGDIELKPTKTFMFALPNTVTLGRTGSFKGQMFGQSKTNPGIRYFVHEKMKKPVLHIREFSKQVLRAQIRGQLCEISLYHPQKDSIKCRKKFPVVLDIVHPFPHLYTAHTEFQTIDTPGYRLFQKYEMPFKLKGTSYGQSGGSPSPGTSPGSSGSNGFGGMGGMMGQGCTCSCKDKARLQALQQQMQKNPSGQPPPALMKLSMCTGRCYATWSKCKSSNKKGGCDCSCAKYKTMMKLQQRLARQGSSNVPPVLMKFMRCMPSCAMSYGKCF